MAARPSWRGEGSRRRDRTPQGKQQTGVAGVNRLSVVEQQARGKPSTAGAGASVSEVSSSGRERHRLDREWTLVDPEGKASGPAACFPNRRIQRAQAGAMAGKASEEEPQTGKNGREEKTPGASAQQEAVLFNRIPGRPAFRQTIFETAGCAKVFA